MTKECDSGLDWPMRVGYRGVTVLVDIILIESCGRVPVYATALVLHLCEIRMSGFRGRGGRGGSSQEGGGRGGI